MPDAALRILQEGQSAHPTDYWLTAGLADELEKRKDSAGYLQYCSAAVSLRPDSSSAHNNLGTALQLQGKRDEAAIEFRKAIELDPKFVGAHLNLGNILLEQGKLDDAIREYRLTIALDPPFAAAAHSALGDTLRAQGKLDEAIRECREAIRLDPRFTWAHNNLGVALYYNKQLAEAIREFRTALDLDPRNAKAHHNLGNALLDQGKVREAIEEYRKALELGLKNMTVYNRLGTTLARQGRLEEAVAVLREAIARDPKYGPSHYNLGTSLSNQGKSDEAITEFRKALALGDDRAEVHCNLGHALKRQGEFHEALQELRRGHELGAERPGWPYPSGKWVRQCRRLAELEKRLPALLAGRDKPASSTERLELAEVCTLKRLHRAAACFYSEAFAEAPKLAEVLDAHRYNAACAATLAATGQGRDAANLDDKERGRLRKEALDWLRADLEAWGRLLEKEPDQAGGVARVLRHWLADPDLAGVRGLEALAERPAAERRSWQQLWNDVSDLLSRAQGKTTPKKPDTK